MKFSNQMVGFLVIALSTLAVISAKAEDPTMEATGNITVYPAGGVSQEEVAVVAEEKLEQAESSRESRNSRD